ncbi:MAG: SurA N-terminal domain-containing protein [Actinobacteria bacterium]|nr:SurA N-terminal domain-containing protein [Actinomycetota bacterium]MCG2802048.1 SurA N-terminal domain-containing protein [Cellulomonas sp.]
MSTAAVVGALAGCSAKPGVAATVNGQQITTQEVATTISDFKPLSGEIAASAVLNELVLEPIYVKVAEKHDLAVSADDAKTAIAAAFQGKSAAPDSTGTIAIARFELTANKISQSTDAPAIAKEIAAELKAASISVNPRFGTFDPQVTSVTSVVTAPTTPAWQVATAAPTAAPTPSQ